MLRPRVVTLIPLLFSFFFPLELSLFLIPISEKRVAQDFKEWNGLPRHNKTNKMQSKEDTKSQETEKKIMKYVGFLFVCCLFVFVLPLPRKFSL